MKRGFPRSLLTVAILAFSPFAGAAQTNTIIVPKDRTDSFGSWSGPLFGGYEFLQIYGQAEFADLPVDVIEITAIAFRWDEKWNGMADRVIPRINLGMGVSSTQGTTFEEYLPNSILVYSGENLRFPVPSWRPPAEFDVTLPLHATFVYDRRRGRLIIRATNPQDLSVDAESNADRGSGIVVRFDSGLLETPDVMITRFSYKIVPFIDSIGWTEGKVEILFTVDGIAGSQVESAERVSGPYATEQNIQLSEISPYKLRAHFAAATEQRFYRIKTR